MAKLWPPKNSRILFNRGTPLEKIEGTKFFKTITKNMFYGILTLAESESGIRKILKNF